METVFYCLCAVWGVLRVVFFLVVPLARQPWLAVLVYGLPTNIQVAVYSLQLLYCAQRVHYERWAAIHRRMYAAYVATNVLLLALFIGVSVAALAKNAGQRWIDTAHNIVFAVCFLLIAAAFAVYSVALARQKRRHALFKHENQRALVALTTTICVCAAVRFVWDVCNIIADRSMVNIPATSAQEHVVTFFMFLVWELVPTFATIYFLGRIPVRENHRCRCCCCCYLYSIVAGASEAPPTPPTGTSDLSYADSVGGEQGADDESTPLQRRSTDQPRRSFDFATATSATPLVGSGSASSASSASSSSTSSALAYAKRGTTQLVNEQHQTLNFDLVTQHMAALAASEVRAGNGSFEPRRASAEYARQHHHQHR